MGCNTLRESVVSANKVFHASLSDIYNEQPHFRPENRRRVSRRIAALAERCGKDVCLDLGCGTGFMIELCEPFFRKLYGVDITPAMMSRVDLSSGKVHLIEADTETIPLGDGAVNMITSNSFLHHLWDIGPTISEACRLLKSGGVFFSEEDPNVCCWNALKKLHPIGNDALSDVLKDERASVLDTHNALGQEINVAPDTVRMAEYQKMVMGGMHADEVESTCYEAGFSRVHVTHYWYLGQGKVMRRSPREAGCIEAYLNEVMPLSRHLFKYLRIEAWK